MAWDVTLLLIIIIWQKTRVAGGWSKKFSDMLSYFDRALDEIAEHVAKHVT